MLRSILFAFALMLGTFAAFAQEHGDCGHPVPDKSIRDCTLVIERGEPGKLAELHLLRGLAHLMKHETDQALADLDTAVRLAPDRAVMFAARGDVHFGRREYERSVADYEEALRRNTNHAAAYVARSFALNKLGRPETPPPGLKEPPAHIDEMHFVLILADRLALLTDPKTKFRTQVEREFAALDQAIAVNPRDGPAYVKRAQALLRFGEPLAEARSILEEQIEAIANFGGYQAARVLADYDRATLVSPTLVDALLARGEFHRLRGHYDRAIADLSEAVRLRPEDGAAYVRRGKASLMKGDYARAVADFGEVMRITPNQPKAYHWRGLAHVKMGQREKAIADFRKATEIGIDIDRRDEGTEREIKLLGVSLAERTRWVHERVIANHQAGITKGWGRSNIASVYFDRCLERIYRGEFDLAAQDCDQAFRLWPENLRAMLVRRARTFARKGETNQAIADFSEAIKIDPRGVDLYFARAEIHFEQGDYDRAIADFTEVLRVPSYVGYHSALTGRGEAYAQKRQFATLIADYDECIRQVSDARAPYYQRGFAYEQLGDRDKAIADYRKVLSFGSASFPRVRASKLDGYTLSIEGLKRTRHAALRWQCRTERGPLAVNVA